MSTIILAFFLLFLPNATPLFTAPSITLKHIRGGVYLVEDSFYAAENSSVYIGKTHVTVIGATWTPETAEIVAKKIRMITSCPITEVINTNYHPDRAG